MLAPTPAEEEARDESEEQEDGEVAPKRARKEAPAKGRTVLTYKQKGEILELLDQKVVQETIAMRYKINVRSVRKVRDHRQQIEDQLKKPGKRAAEAFKIRPSMAPAVEAAVLSSLREASSQGLPVQRAKLSCLAGKAKEDLLASGKLGEEEAKKLAAFTGGASWAKRFMKRHELSKAKPRGQGGSSSADAAAAGQAGTAAASPVGGGSGGGSSGGSSRSGGGGSSSGGGGGSSSGGGASSGGGSSSGEGSSSSGGEAGRGSDAQRREEPAPPYSAISEAFSLLEGYAHRAGIADASEALRNAKMAFILARNGMLE